MKEKLMRFMQGRYGTDQLSRFLTATAMICVVLGLFIRSRFLQWIPLLLLIIVYARMLSKNTGKRYRENIKYLELQNRAMGTFRGWKEAFDCRKTHRIYACPGCGQKVRVPKGRGTVKIHCPSCHLDFIKKS